MNNLTELKQRLIEYLSGLTALEGAAVTASYDEKPRAFPIKSPVITVGIGGVEHAPAGLGGYLGGDAPAYGVNALVTLRFGIHAASADECGMLYETLCSALFDASVFGVTKTSCGKTGYDVKSAACFLQAEAVLRALWTTAKPEQRLFTEIQFREELQA